MKKIYFRKDGTPCRYPPSKSAARKIYSRRYDSGILCLVCSDREETTYTRFTVNDECIRCTRLVALKEYEDRIRAGSPSSTTEAIAQGLDHYYRPDMCPKAGHTGKRTLNGECYKCNLPRSPLLRDRHPDLILTRDAAKALGFTVYRTGKTCRKGHTGFRYVSNNGCIPCKEER